MKAIWKGTILAESADTVVADDNHYFPSSSLHRQHFEESSTRTN